MYRKVDSLGRIVIPKEIREELNLRENTSLRIKVKNSNIILGKIAESCKICGNSQKIDLHFFDNTWICNTCIQKIKRL